MLKGFKEFIMQGNVIDLAVAVVIGTAFASIVDAFTTAIINPLIALLGGNREIGFAVQILDNNPETIMDFGALITAIINFLLIAAVIYFVLVGPMNKMKEAAAKRKGITRPPRTTICWWRSATCSPVGRSRTPRTRRVLPATPDLASPRLTAQPWWGGRCSRHHWSSRWLS